MTMSGEEQLKAWVAGQSVHNPDTDECCPDFSCCVTELQAPQEERSAFFGAWERGDVAIMERFLTTFKQRAEVYADKNRCIEISLAPDEGVILKELPL